MHLTNERDQMNTTQKWNGFGTPCRRPALLADLATNEHTTLLAQAPQIMAEAQAKRWVTPTAEVQSSKFKVQSSKTKTGRIYGAVWQHILGVARQQDQFSTRDLCPPLAQKVARQNCAKMAKAGLLVRIREALPGRHGISAVYALRRCSRCGQASAASICFDCQAQIYRASPGGQELLSMVCETFAVGQAEIFSGTRLEHIAEARMALCYCLHRFGGWNYSRIGRFLGRDHSGIAYAVQAIADRIQLSAGLREKISLIEQRFSRGTTCLRRQEAQTAAAAPQVSTAPAAATPQG